MQSIKVTVLALSVSAAGVALVGCASDDAPKAVRTSAATVGEQLSAQDFMKKAALSGLYEVESSRLAASKGIPQADKDFANRMVSDHTKANDELKRLAQQKQINVPTELDAAHQKKIDELRKLDGQEFARKYHDQQLKAHEEAVALFQRASQQLTDNELKAFAAKTLPALQEHLQMCKGCHPKT
jgi:putative membrane protein